MEIMDAGRKLDELVAERVMGHRRLEEPSRVDVPASLGEQKYERIFNWKINGTLMEYPPQYSTSIDDAWMVMERLRKMPRFEIVDIRLRGEGGVAIMTPCGNLMDCLVIADTAPLAICLAALKAVDTSPHSAYKQ